MIIVHVKFSSCSSNFDNLQDDSERQLKTKVFGEVQAFISEEVVVTPRKIVFPYIDEKISHTWIFEVTNLRESFCLCFFVYHFRKVMEHSLCHILLSFFLGKWWDWIIHLVN